MSSRLRYELTTAVQGAARQQNIMRRSWCVVLARDILESPRKGFMHNPRCLLLLATLTCAVFVDAAERDRGEWLCEKVDQVARQLPTHNVIGFKEGLVDYDLPAPLPYNTRKISFPDGCPKSYTFHGTVGKSQRIWLKEQKLRLIAVIMAWWQDNR